MTSGALIQQKNVNPFQNYQQTKMESANTLRKSNLFVPESNIKILFSF